MREFLSDLKYDKKIFIGDYDSYWIIKHKITCDHLLFVTKSALLLFDRILLPAAFFWQSKEMTQIMLRLEKLISQGLILPMIRDPGCTTDVYDYFERRVDESQKIGSIDAFRRSELASEIAGSRNQKEAKLLNSIHTYAHLDKTSVRDLFKSNWISDLENYTDIHSIRMLLFQSNITNQRLEQICDILLREAEFTQFSRASCIDRIQKAVPPGRIQSAIEERVSWLYLKSNALSYDSNFYFTYNPYNGMVFEENLGLLLKSLEAFGISEHLLHHLTLNDILQIKGSGEYRNFIIAYRELINSVYTRQGDIIGMLKKRIAKQMSLEKSLFGIHKKLSLVQACSASVFSGLLINHFSNNQINIPVFIGSGSVTILSQIMKRICAMNQYMQTRPFADFKNYILTNQYEASILKSIGE